MRITKAVEFMQVYAVCEKCGNDKIGDGEGALEITDNTFLRTCKCGWAVKIESKEAEHD